MESQYTVEKETLRKAKILFASGKLSESVELFNIAEKYGYGCTDLWLSRGAAHMAQGNYQDAEKDFSRVLDEDEKNERAYYFRGIALVALGRYEDGISDLTSSLRRNNDRGIAHLIRGLAYLELGQQFDAKLDLNSASAFSNAEIESFRKLFGNFPGSFPNTRSLLAEESAPWNTLLSHDSANTLMNLLQ